MEEFSVLSNYLKELREYLNNFRKAILIFEENNVELAKQNDNIKENLNIFNNNISYTMDDIYNFISPRLDNYIQFYNTNWNFLSYKTAKKRDWLVFFFSLLLALASFFLGLYINTLSQEDSLKNVHLLFNRNTKSIISSVRCSNSKNLKNYKILIDKFNSLQLKIDNIIKSNKKTKKE